MKFNSVKFKNFLCYGDELQSINLSRRGITLIIGNNNKDGGSNGAGKSTAIVESIVYGLFGKTTKKIKADNVVNNKTKKDCFVEVEFLIGNDLYKVRRYRKHTEFGNSLFLEKNSVNISGVDKQETQNILESIIKVSYKSFVSSIVLSQEKVANFTNSDPLERRKIIENLLMFDFITKYHRASKEIIRAIQPEINSLKLSINEKKDSINILSRNLISYIDKKELEEKLRLEEIENLKKELKKLDNINVKDELDIKYKLKEVDESIINLERNLTELINNRNELNTRKDDLLRKLHSKEKEVDKIKNNPTVCPVCKNRLNKENLIKYLNDKKIEIDDINNSLKNIDDKLSYINNDLTKLNEKINLVRMERDSLKQKVKTNLQIEELLNYNEKINSIKQKIEILESFSLNIEEDEYVKDTIDSINKKKKELKELKVKLKNLEEEVVYYDWWKNALSNSPDSLKTFCVNKILNSLNNYINYYLSFFNYDINYKLNNELEDFITKDGENIEFGQLSGGEKRALEVSLVFALYEIVKSKLPDNINLIVLDELLSENFDDVRVGGAIDILTELEEKGLSVFIIDHKQSISDLLSYNVILVEKDKNGNSRLIDYKEVN